MFLVAGGVYAVSPPSVLPSINVHMSDATFQGNLAKALAPPTFMQFQEGYVGGLVLLFSVPVTVFDCCLLFPLCRWSFCRFPGRLLVPADGEPLQL